MEFRFHFLRWVKARVDKLTVTYAQSTTQRSKPDNALQTKPVADKSSHEVHSLVVKVEHRVGGEGLSNNGKYNANYKSV